VKNWKYMPLEMEKDDMTTNEIDSLASEREKIHNTVA
jgi:hypothetical protein